MIRLKYLDCNIIETITRFICTNQHGLTIGESMTLEGAKSIIESYLEKKEREKTAKKHKYSFYEIELRDCNGQIHNYIVYDIKDIKIYIDFAIDKNQEIKSIKGRTK